MNLQRGQLGKGIDTIESLNAVQILVRKIQEGAQCSRWSDGEACEATIRGLICT
jgi:hypothetical protein